MATAKEKGIPDSPTALVGNTGFSKAVALAIQFFRPDLYLADDVEAAKEAVEKLTKSMKDADN